MRRIETEEILIPLLEGYYQDSESFYAKFDKLIKNGGEIFLQEPLGFSLIITNIIENKDIEFLLDILKNSKKFIMTVEGKDRLDNGLFGENLIFSFNRYVFKCEEILAIEVDGNIDFSLFVNILKTNLNHHAISFVLTTMTDFKSSIASESEYYQLSNKRIINFLKADDTSEMQKLKICIKRIEPNIVDLLKIDKNTFIGIEFWRREWIDDNNNILEASKYIKENPYYFYSILTAEENVFRRNFKNIMNLLGWCFSSSRVQCGLFSRNVYLAISLKPRNEIIETTGHDGTEFRAWEILALQKHLLNLIDIYYGEYTLKHEAKSLNKMNESIRELDIIYDFNAIFKKVGKGEIWIKFNTYLQDSIGISAYHDLYISRHEKMLEEEDRFENLKLTRINTILSGLIFSTIFVTIALFLLDGKQNYVCQLMYNQSISEFGEVAKVSLVYTFIIALIFLIIFFYFIVPVMKKLLLRRWI